MVKQVNSVIKLLMMRWINMF